MKQTSGRTVAIAAGLICIFLAITLIGVIINYNSIINTKNNELTQKTSTINSLNSQISAKNTQIAENENTISSLNSQIANQTSQIQTLANQNSQLQTWLNGNITTFTSQIVTLQNQLDSLTSQLVTLQNQTLSDQSTIAALQGQIASANSQVSSLNSTVTTLQNQTDDLTAIINMSKTQLQTLVFHVCEKGDGYSWGRIPNVSDTYNQILALNNNTYNILLLPEYQGHKNWTEELAWLANNFGGPQGIPIMLDVFGGGEDSIPIPILSTADIQAAMATCNIQYLRIAEVISWHMEHSLELPTAYIAELLNFARANNLKIFWTEWKADYSPNVETVKAIQTYIQGYEDIVTVSFSTNSQDAQPPDGLLKLHEMFPHWGASIQAWYWDTYHDSLLNMPPSLLVQHALSAKQIGAEIIQFEPYWYFFDNGQVNENLRLLEIMLS